MYRNYLCLTKNAANGGEKHTKQKHEHMLKNITKILWKFIINLIISVISAG